MRTLSQTSPELVFVRSSWLRSYWEHRTGPDMGWAHYKELHTRYMLKVIAEHTVRIVEFDGVNEVLGYSVVAEFSGKAIWVYVKKPYRRQHIAKVLLGGCVEYTCDTKAGRKLATGLNLQFNPY